MGKGQVHKSRRYDGGFLSLEDDSQRWGSGMKGQWAVSHKNERIRSKTCRMTANEATSRTTLGAPAWAFSISATARVQAKTAHSHENMIARTHIDGDEAARASFSV